MDIEMDGVAHILKTDEAIQPIIAMPGWKVLQETLVEEAKREREAMEPLLDDLIEKNLDADKNKWHESRVRYLSLIRAAQIFADIRQAAYEVKQRLAEEERVEKISRKAEGSEA
jgi:hypothetical protein